MQRVKQVAAERLIDQPTPFDRFMEAAAFIAFLYLWGFTLKIFNVLPEEIPVHFDGTGVPNDWGPKSTIFILPGVGTFCFILITVIPRFKKFNYPFKITPENEVVQYQYALRLLRAVKVVVLLVCIILVHAIYNAITSEDPVRNMWLLPLILFLVFAPILIYVFYSWKDR